MLHTRGMTGRAWGRWVAVGAVFAALSGVVSPALAAEPVAPPPTEIFARERPTTRSFYGWQILASGGVGGAVAAASVAFTESPLKSFPSAFGFIVGMPVYAIGGPATHWSHGDFSKGLISLSGNFALPLAGGLIGQSVHCGSPDDASNCATRGFFGGFAIALLTAPLLDAVILGWENIPDDDPEGPPVPKPEAGGAPARRAARASHFTMAPAWNVGPRGEIGIGVSGRF
ncbi:MAG: hypothetical protein ABW133_16495 [Polyangiaceae bacterium]